jgi:hypothetical protein
MRKIPLAIMAASMLAVSPAAHAAVTITQTTIPNTVFQTPSGSFNIGFNDAFGAAGPFSEFLEFMTTVGGVLSVTATTTANAVGGSNDTDFGNISFAGPGVNTLIPASADNTDQNEDRQLNNIALLAGGTYRLTINGTPGTESGGFGGELVFNAAPAVPEPATWAMMLIGFGFLGAAMRRKKDLKPTARVRFA